jgi:hypothetical protein
MKKLIESMQNLSGTHCNKGFKASHRKDALSRGYQAIRKENGLCFMDVRLYRPNEVVYCCAWVSDRASNTYLSGSGKAGDCGYHKQSAAMSDAFRAMGLDADFGGRGESSMLGAIEAIAEGLNIVDYVIVQMYP